MLSNNRKRKLKLTILSVVSRTEYGLIKQVTKTHSSSSTTATGCYTDSKTAQLVWRETQIFFSFLSDRKSLFFLLAECLFCENKNLELVWSALVKTLAGSVLEFGGVRWVFIVAWKLAWKPKPLFTTWHVHAKVRYMYDRNTIL